MAATLRLEMADHVDSLRWSWRLSDSRDGFLAGERDAAVLTEGIDDNSAQLVRRVLEFVES